jgi:hypothetical protein
LKKAVFGCSQTVICIRDFATTSVGDHQALEKQLLKFGVLLDHRQKCAVVVQDSKAIQAAMLKNVFVLPQPIVFADM